MRATIAAFAAAAFLMVLGGIAWACLPYHGEISVYPVNPGGQAVDSFAHGERSVTIHGGAGQTGADGETRGGMIWCNDTGGFEDAEPYQAGAIRPSSGSPDLMVVVEDRRSGCVDDSGQWDLPEGTYNVSLNHAVYSEMANPDFDKNSIAEEQGDRDGSCYYTNGDDPDDYDYVHDEQLIVEDGEDNDGSLVIDDLDMAPSSSLGFDNVAGLCLREQEGLHVRGPIVPVEILDPADFPGPGGGPGGGRGMGNGNGMGNGPR